MSNSTTTVTFRTATEAECPRLQEMIDALYAAFPGHPGKDFRVDRTWREFNSKPDKGRIVSFEHGGQLVGYAIIVFFWSNEFGGDVIEIDELYVDAIARGTGLAKAFFQWLDEAYPESVGKSLQVADDNVGARRLYERVGFKLSKNNHMFWIK